MCPSCLNIFDDIVLEQFIATLSKEEADKYKCREFCTAVSLPKCILLRQYSIYLYLNQKFPELLENHIGKLYCEIIIFHILLFGMTFLKFDTFPMFIELIYVIIYI